MAALLLGEGSIGCVGFPPYFDDGALLRRILKGPVELSAELPHFGEACCDLSGVKSAFMPPASLEDDGGAEERQSVRLVT